MEKDVKGEKSMGDLRVQWQEEVEIVFYNMWGDYTLQRRIEKAEANFYCGIEIRNDLLSAFNIQYNNSAFLEMFRYYNNDKERKYSFDDFVKWLTELMDDYVRRSFEQEGCKKVDDNSWSIDQSRIKWLNNTSFLIERESPKLAQWCEEQKKQVAEFYKNAEQYKSNGLITEEPTTEVIPQTKYSPGLLALFKNHAELIDELARESDDEIARQIKKWAKEKDETGRALIENPENGLRLKYAQLLKEAGIIKLSVESFRKKL